MLRLMQRLMQRATSHQTCRDVACNVSTTIPWDSTQMTQFQGKNRIETTRLPGWDYRNAGWYFVTICTRNKEAFFGDVVDGSVRLSHLGEAAQRFWLEIPAHIPTVTIDVFVVMPNHIHGILAIVETLHATSLHATSLHASSATSLHATSPQPKAMSTMSPKAGSLGAVIRSYKAAVTTWAKQNSFVDFAWQPRYWDHVIRDEHALRAIRQYICDNPLRWALDRENPIGPQM